MKTQGDILKAQNETAKAQGQEAAQKWLWNTGNVQNTPYHRQLTAELLMQESEARMAQLQLTGAENEAALNKKLGIMSPILTGLLPGLLNSAGSFTRILTGMRTPPAPNYNTTKIFTSPEKK